ncbi:hypothetical protein HK104_007165 [Borealophlyctis nickersoniae]|nr:hypothetical protein HK104_007165 [Borealophlyctis nickersoniae]
MTATLGDRVATNLPGITVSPTVDLQNTHVTQLLTAVQSILCTPETEPSHESVDAIARKYFHENYEQHVDGKVRNYEGLVSHLLAQKKVLDGMDVHYERVIAKGNMVATYLHVKGKKKDGSVVEGSAIAVFKFAEDGRVIRCDENSEMHAAGEDADLGSRT